MKTYQQNLFQKEGEKRGKLFIKKKKTKSSNDSIYINVYDFIYLIYAILFAYLYKV